MSEENPSTPPSPEPAPAPAPAPAPKPEPKPKPKSEAERLAEEYGYNSVEAHDARVREAREREAAK